MADSSAAEAERDLQVYFFVMLRKGPTWSPEVTPEVEATQAAHLANLDRLAAEGKLLLAGPFLDSPVDAWRGLVILRAGSLEEAQALTATDPAVQSGRLAMDVIPWATGRDQLSAPGIALDDFLAE